MMVNETQARLRAPHQTYVYKRLLSACWVGGGVGIFFCAVHHHQTTSQLQFIIITGKVYEVQNRKTPVFNFTLFSVRNKLNFD